ncbi:MAG: PQQ-like beta-propeller repeat protein [Sphingorhabdus sp.]|jgi:outer membrane protein assembly factor BamB|uniref:PQQ-binding-like beta-propeller repeat protein n=2 Tax=Sphingorhabdus sp. TaxID=1902408 RepID=UPI00273E4B78|nr:PQQ-binding-like beta-propeller repeat protein [Sphingorhabdus sp.]MDP4757385.1 PQQ-like beta-propeller repeat protein [Sphingorhabdus sp.]MDP4872703.1 PQQ-like beta-propeller repeat protein [Sphingorhabdus sp.]MDP4927468.1 PQQ-like beta-propeller repeat protein [Sphingorhabdus sp.]
MKTIAKLLLALAATTTLGGCAVIDGVRGDSGKKGNTPTIGSRVNILGIERDTEVDPALAGFAVTLPPAAVNEAWAQPGGNASKSPGHVELGQGLSRIWTAKVTGANPRARLAASPVMSDGRIYVVDTTARVTAFDANTGAQIWSNALEIEKDGKPSRFGGGVSATGTNVFATNGVGDVASLAADTGALVWKKRPAGPLRGAPTLSNGNVYVMTQDNQIYALRQSDGEAQWNEAGPVSASGIFGVGAPAAAQGTIIAGYSSGELAAYRYENGRSLWSDTLSRTAMSTSVSTLTDIDADPVIDRGRVFALGKGGRMASYELVSGQRIWEINIAGISTPVTSGEWVFVMTDEARLLCVARSTGKIRWISKLQRYKNEKKKKKPISWYGPVLAGGRLVITNSHGAVWSVAPDEGTATEILDVGNDVSLAPIVANNILYILDDSGRISAFRG